mgnify:CR=1
MIHGYSVCFVGRKQASGKLVELVGHVEGGGCWGEVVTGCWGKEKEKEKEEEGRLQEGHGSVGG